MARPIVITWPALDHAAVSALQTTAGAGSLIINGTLSSSIQGNFPAIASFNNLQRTVSLTSTGNLSAVNFTITGMLEGATVSQTIAGPSNNTVQTTQLFNTVTSVTVDGAVGTNVSVGSGSSGQMPWLKYNYNATVFGLTAAIAVTGTINYSVVATLDEVNINSNPMLFNPNSLLVSQTTSLVGPFGIQDYPYTGTGAPTYDTPIYAPLPLNYYTAVINSSSAGGSIIATFIQQGIT